MPHVVTMNTTFRYITANVHMVSVVKTAKVISLHKVINDFNQPRSRQQRQREPVKKQYVKTTVT